MVLNDRVVKWATVIAMITLGIVLVLVIVLLLPSLLEGPDRVHYLVRSRCKIVEIEFVDNLCKRDTSTDFSNLIYKDDWEICKVVHFNITARLGLANLNNISCIWNYSDFFKDDKEALVTISKDYSKNSTYDCVVDTLNNICYPDKNEDLIFGITVGILVFLFIISISVHLVARRWIQLRKVIRNREVEERLGL